MATLEALTVFLGSLEAKSYYGILRVSPDATAAEIKSAFHEFSLLYHPDRYVDSPPEVGCVATAVYKRGVEAYRCLSKTPSRARYDKIIAKGKLRLDASAVSVPPPPIALRTLEALARTPRGKALALKADRLIAIGQLEAARVALVTAMQCEPGNDDLSERLEILYEALALEPL